MQQHMWKYTPSRITTRTQRMQWLTTFRPYLYPADVKYTAARRGDMELVEWLHSCCRYEAHVAMVEAAKNGHLALVEWLSARQDTKINGILPQKTKWTETEILIPLGPRGVVVWQTFHRRRGDDGRKGTHSEHFATPHGREEYEYWQGYGMPLRSFPFFSGPLYAAKCGELSLIRRLHEDTETPWQWSSKVLDVAAENGHLSPLQWLYEHRSEECTADAVFKAASNGHLYVLEWLDSVKVFDSIEPEREWEGTIASVVGRGHVEVTKWLYSSHPRLKVPADIFLGYPYYAANRAWQRFDLFRWFHTQDPQGYPVTISHYYIAVMSHCSIEQIEWARARLGNCALSDSFNWARNNGAFIHAELELVQYLNK